MFFGRNLFSRRKVRVCVCVCLCRAAVYGAPPPTARRRRTTHAERQHRWPSCPGTFPPPRLKGKEHVKEQQGHPNGPAHLVVHFVLAEALQEEREVLGYVRFRRSIRSASQAVRRKLAMRVMLHRVMRVSLAELVKSALTSSLGALLPSKWLGGCAESSTSAPDSLGKLQEWLQVPRTGEPSTRRASNGRPARKVASLAQRRTPQSWRVESAPAPARAGGAMHPPRHKAKAGPCPPFPGAAQPNAKTRARATAPLGTVGRPPVCPPATQPGLGIAAAPGAAGMDARGPVHAWTEVHRSPPPQGTASPTRSAPLDARRRPRRTGLKRTPPKARRRPATAPTRDQGGATLHRAQCTRRPPYLRLASGVSRG